MKRPIPATPDSTPETKRPAAPRKTAGAALYDPEHSIGYLLNRAANILAARFGDELKPHEINLQAWRVLISLGHEDGQSLTDLANHTGAELSYLSRSVASVEERGFVKRVPSPTDRRTVLLSLTPAGRQMVRRLTPAAMELEGAALAGVTKSELDVTVRTLQAIYHNLVLATEEVVGVNRKITVARRVHRREQGENGG